jgi:hypothetical protein
MVNIGLLLILMPIWILFSWILEMFMLNDFNYLSIMLSLNNIYFANIYKYLPILNYTIKIT